MVNYCRDTYFCLIMNEHTLLVEEEARKSVADRSGEIIPLPIRIFCEDYMLIRDIVETQLRQMLVSYKVPCRNMRRFLEDIGQPRDLFPYFLYFDGFAVGKKSYSRTKGTQNCELVESVGYDAAQVNLSVHFEMDATDIKAHFRYNAYVFSGYTAEPLAKNYAVCLHNLLYGWDDRFEEYSQKTRSDMGKWDDTFYGYIY